MAYHIFFIIFQLISNNTTTSDYQPENNLSILRTFSHWKNPKKFPKSSQKISINESENLTHFKHINNKNNNTKPLQKELVQEEGRMHLLVYGETPEGLTFDELISLFHPNQTTNENFKKNIKTRQDERKEWAKKQQTKNAPYQGLPIKKIRENHEEKIIIQTIKQAAHKKAKKLAIKADLDSKDYLTKTTKQTCNCTIM